MTPELELLQKLVANMDLLADELGELRKRVTALEKGEK